MLPGLSEWLEAFWELSTERQIGMAYGPIPASAIRQWIVEHRIGAGECKVFKACIRAMDRIYLDHISKGNKADRIMSEPFGPGMLRGKT